MRGEETQIVGAAAMGQLEGTFVLPGTHSKWALVRARRVEAYATYMSGELYAALRDHSILGNFMRPGPLSEEGLRLCVEAARRSGANCCTRRSRRARCRCSGISARTWWRTTCRAFSSAPK
ncbi:2-dehydro-3-deoxygalactonokinase [Roseitalea porphyridii]|uniref:2-dehydro-3-deoxygalactonokinase n=1 Tax=Roseitalea porphyridii TaxID=1852022 RepID=UPI0032F02F3F